MESGFLEFETILKEIVEQSKEKESNLMNELLKKDEYLKIFYDSSANFNKAELQYRLTISLLEKKIERQERLINNKLNCDEYLAEESEFYKKENVILKQQVKQIPLLMKTQKENILLKENSTDRNKDFFKNKEKILNENSCLLNTIENKLTVKCHIFFFTFFLKNHYNYLIYKFKM